MSKESDYKIQKVPVFSENFNDEQSVRKNGGIPTAVTFANGIGSFNGSSSYITNNKLIISGIYSIRIKCNVINYSSDRYLIDFRGSNGDGTGYVRMVTPTGEIAPSSGNKYVNGVLNSIAPSNSNIDIIVTGITLKIGTGSIYNYIGEAFNASAKLLGSIELFEIYEGTLTAQEVKNLYNQKRYKPTDTLTPIIDVDAFGGAIKNRANSTAITNTDVITVRDGNIYAMKFNGTTSKLDLGAYNSLVGDITLCAWVKKSLGNSTSRYLDNGKLIVRESTPANNLYVLLSDGATSTSSFNSNSGKVQTYQNLIITRTSAGVTNFYINGVISGTANQSSGTPVAGTTNIIIGNNSASGNPYSGNIAQLQVFSGIMSVDEIAQKFSNERRLYNV